LATSSLTRFSTTLTDVTLDGERPVLDDRNSANSSLAASSSVVNGGYVSAPAAASANAFAANSVVSTITVQAASGDATFKLELDAKAATAPSSYTSGWTTAATLLSEVIHDPITINLEIGYTEYPQDNSPIPSNVALGGDAYGTTDSYSQVRGFLSATGASDVVSAVNALPATNSLNGTSSFYVASAEEKAFGQIASNATAIDGYAGFGTGWGGLIVGAALHEFTHAMGREVGDSVLSLFRYTSSGTHYFGNNTPAPSTYFSVDGGKTVLADFGQNSDPSDFLNNSLTANDPFGEFAESNSLTALDRTMLDMLGFGGTSPPPPPSSPPPPPAPPPPPPPLPPSPPPPPPPPPAPPPPPGNDDYRNTFSDTSLPLGHVAVGGTATGTVNYAGDTDVFAVTLSAGTRYTFNLDGYDISSSYSLHDPYLRLLSSSGKVLATSDDISATNFSSEIDYTTGGGGTYYLVAASSPSDATYTTGNYQIRSSVAAPAPAATTLSGAQSDQGGNQGFTIIPAAGGDQTLTAGPKPEIFDFSSLGFGNDTIVGFDPAQDALRLGSGLAQNFATVSADMSVTPAGGTLIALDKTHSIILSGVSPSSLGATNFRFS
jgi:hypothetical protein